MNQGSSGTYLGVDIGGTKIAVGVVDNEGKILAQSRSPMVANGTAEAGFDAVDHAIRSMIETDAARKVQGIGICAPGPLDPHSGVVLNPPNVPCWRNFPLAARVGAKYRVPVKIDNDANAAALAETRWGAARGYKYVFYATIGTGHWDGYRPGWVHLSRQHRLSRRRRPREHRLSGTNLWLWQARMH